MAAKKVKGITVEFEGNTAGLGKVLKEIDKEAEKTERSLKSVNAALKLDPTNTTLVEQKQRLLASAISNTSDKLNVLKQAQESAAKTVGNYDAWRAAYDPLKTAIDEAKAKLSALKAEMREMEDIGSVDTEPYILLQQEAEETRTQLKSLQKQAKDVSEEFGNPISQDEYDKLQREIVFTEKELSSLIKEQKEFGDTVNAVANGALENFNDTLRKTDDAAEEAGDGFTVAKGAVADFVSDAVQSAIGWIKDLIGELFNLADATEEFQTMQSKLAGSADTFGYSMEFASGAYQNFYRYLSDDQAATNAITNLMGLRTSTESLKNLANASIAVWTAYGDSIPIESLTENINETAQVAKVTGVLADALNWAGISEDFFNQQLAACSSTQERANLIAATLNNTYAVSKTRYDQLNGSILANNEAEQRLAATEAQLGEAMRPVNTELTELKNELLVMLLPLITELAQGFADLLGWLREHPTVLQILTGAVIGLAGAFLLLAAAMAIQGIVSMLSVGFMGLGSAMSMLPVVGIVAGIGVIVGCLIYLGTHLDELKAMWSEGWNSIKSDYQAGQEALVTGTHDSLSAQSALVSDFWSSTKAEYQAGQAALVTGTHASLNAQVEAFTSFKQNTLNLFSSWGANIKSEAASAIESVKTAISSGLERIKSLFRFEWSLPHIKLPHFYVSGSFSLNPPQVPSFGVQWYAKGAILNGAQLFGMLGGNFLGGGEAGPEAVLPLSSFYDNLNSILTSFLRANVTPNDSRELLSRLDGIYDRLGRLQVLLDTGTLVGEIVDQMDAALGARQRLAERGV